MRRLIDRCAGIDVGKALLVVAVRLAEPDGGCRQEVRSFGATTPDLLALRDWLELLGVTHVAMESTGVYWKAPYYVLEDAFEVLLVNAAHLKHVPGRKTDVMGVSGRQMMRAMVEGIADPEALAELAKARLRAKLPELRQALTGRFRDHHAFPLGRMLAHIEALEDDIAAISERVAVLIKPFEAAVVILDSITGVGPRAAEVMLAEIGADMSVFPSPAHLASWAGRCPGQRESAGRRGSGKPRKGSPWLADTLTECAWAAVKVKGSYLSAYYGSRTS
jgi:transposase